MILGNHKTDNFHPSTPIPCYDEVINFVSLTLKSVDESLWCDHSDESSLAERLQDTIFIA